VVFGAVALAQGWKVGLGASAFAFLAYFPVVKWLLERHPEYARLKDQVSEFRFRNREPLLVLALRRLEPGHGLEGGSVKVS
jgi:hypothetical protein